VKSEIKVSLSSKIEEFFGMDLRSLALYRIGISLLVIADLIVRATYLKTFYTDFGALPRYALIEKFSVPGSWSLHLVSGHVLVQAVLFLFAGLFALMLCFGYRTRLASFMTWVFMMSLHARNPWVLQGGDILFHMLIFWGMFLPLGACYSVDRALMKSPPPENESQRFISMGTVGFFAQIVIVYWATAAHKISPASFPVWVKEGIGVYRALSVDQFTTPVGYFFLQFPWFLKLLNYAVLSFELLGPFLLFWPVKTARVRIIGVFSYWALQFGFSWCMELGPFPWVTSIGMLAFLPPLTWEKLSSIKKCAEIRSNIFNKVEGAYRWVAKNRFIASKLLSYSPKPSIVIRPPELASGLAAFCLIYILIWNVGNFNPKLGVPPNLRWIGFAFGLEQKWAMFSPPLTDDGWYVIPGKLKNGSEVDVFRNGEPVTWEKPARVAKMYKNERWRKYMMNVWMASNRKHRLYYGQYLCRDWNTRHQGDLQLEEFEIFFMREDTVPPGETPHAEKISLWKHWCFKVPEDVKIVEE